MDSKRAQSLLHPAPEAHRPVHPFLKWAGGKRSLLDDLLSVLPKRRISHYIEPFLGGGALFIELARRGRIERATLADRNSELTETWRAVREAPLRVARAFDTWPQDPDSYYRVRAIVPLTLDRWHRAARMLYLNRNGFNGLYRLNRQGQFNVPYGAYKRPIALDVDNLVAVSDLLKCARIVNADFEAVMALAEPGDVVYCDPPYWPLSETSSFNAYDGCFFGPEDQARLASTFKAVGDRLAYGVLSNSDTPETRALYRGRRLRVRTVFAPRPINRNADGRQRIAEILVTAGSRRVAR